MATLQLLVDIEVLAHTDYLVGSMNSGVPHLVEVCSMLQHQPPFTSCARSTRTSCSVM